MPNRPASRQGVFLSTPSVGRATWAAANKRDHRRISIHALRGEGDGKTLTPGMITEIFLSTPSVGRATIS